MTPSSHRILPRRLTSSSRHFSSRTLVRSIGLRPEWIWADTCCIDKKDDECGVTRVVGNLPCSRGSIVAHPSRSSTFVVSGCSSSSLATCGEVLIYQEYVAAERIGSRTLAWVCSTTRNHLLSFQRWRKCRGVLYRSFLYFNQAWRGFVRRYVFLPHVK